MGMFDSMFGRMGQDATNSPDYGWLTQLLQQRQQQPSSGQPVDARPDDIMNPTNGWGRASAGHAPLSDILPQMLPPMNGGAQPSPWLPAPRLSGAEPSAVWGGPAPQQASAAQSTQQQPPGPPLNILPQNVPYLAEPQAQNAMAQARPEAESGLGQRMLAGARNFSDPHAGLIARLANSFQGISSGENTNPAYAQHLQETGTDLMGNKSFAWANPLNQTLKPANMGAAATGATADIQAALAMPPRYNEHGRDQSFLDALDPTTKSVVTSILDGNSSVTPRNLQRFLPLATRAEQGFVGQTYSTRANGLKDFYGGGKSSETMRKTNQSALHFGELVTDKMAALPGHDLPAMNAAENFIKTNLMGSGAQGNFEVNAHALADELSGMFKGAGISDAEIRAWESKLSPNMSPEQQRGMAKTLLGLYEDSVTALDKKRQEQVGPAIAAQKGPILGPEASAALDKVRKFIGGQKVDEQKSGGGLKAGTYNWTPQGLQ